MRHGGLAEISWNKENQRPDADLVAGRSACFDLREYDAELELVRESIKTRQESLTLVKSREEGVSNLPRAQAKTLVDRLRQPSPARMPGSKQRTHRVPIGQTAGQSLAAGALPTSLNLQIPSDCSSIGTPSTSSAWRSSN
jgi:hypothetical protein